MNGVRSTKLECHHSAGSPAPRPSMAMSPFRSPGLCRAGDKCNRPRRPLALGFAAALLAVDLLAWRVMAARLTANGS